MTDTEEHKHLYVCECGRVLHQRGRLRGVQHPAARLTEDDVREIRRLHVATFFTNRDIGLKFGISHVAVYKIISRQTWAHIN